MDILKYNREAWNKQVEKLNPWTQPVGEDVIASARAGLWHIVLTPTKPVPRDWFPALKGLEVLCLASGGGQQGPILAAAGARVTVLDNSPRQLDQDRVVAQREGLEIKLVEGDMADLSMFADESFGLIVNPVSNLFIEDVLPVWNECYRVLKPGGILITGFINPVVYLFDLDLMDAGELKLCHKLPYSDQKDLSPAQLKQLMEDHSPLEFSHMLQDQIGGQLAAGFLLSGFYEDINPKSVISEYLPTFIATRAIKPSKN